jgi:hypothetical protein
MQRVSLSAPGQTNFRNDVTGQNCGLGGDSEHWQGTNHDKSIGGCGCVARRRLTFDDFGA